MSLARHNIYRFHIHYYNLLIILIHLFANNIFIVYICLFLSNGCLKAKKRGILFKWPFSLRFYIDIPSAFSTAVAQDIDHPLPGVSVHSSGWSMSWATECERNVDFISQTEGLMVFCQNLAPPEGGLFKVCTGFVALFFSLLRCLNNLDLYRFRCLGYFPTHLNIT